MKSSRYANLSRVQTGLVAGGLCAVTFLSVWISTSTYRISFEDRPRHAQNDIDLYYAETQSIRDGENYYDVAQRELKARGYPTHSVFNWRTPLPMWLLGQLPAPQFGKIILGSLTIGLILCGVLIVQREGTMLEAFLAGCLLGGTAIPIFAGTMFVMPVLWAGVLIGLSLCCFGLNRPYAAVAFGIGAAFFRELAVGYGLVMLVYAIVTRKRNEVVAWLLALVLYATFFCWHVSVVSGYLGTSDVVQAGEWMRLGGLSFLIACAHVTGFLLILPQWAAAIFLCVAMFGLIGWKSDTGLRTGLTVAAYLAVFSVFGKDVNQYWGAMIAPLLCLAFAKTPTAIRDVWMRARGETATCTTDAGNS